MRRWYERQFKIWSGDKKDNSKWRKLEMNASWKEDANSIVKWAPIAFCVYNSIVKAQHLSNKNWAIFVFEKSISKKVKHPLINLWSMCKPNNCFSLSEMFWTFYKEYYWHLRVSTLNFLQNLFLMSFIRIASFKNHVITKCKTNSN